MNRINFSCPDTYARVSGEAPQTAQSALSQIEAENSLSVILAKLGTLSEAEQQEMLIPCF